MKKGKGFNENASDTEKVLISVIENVLVPFIKEEILAIIDELLYS